MIDIDAMHDLKIGLTSMPDEFPVVDRQPVNETSSTEDRTATMRLLAGLSVQPEGGQDV